MMPWMSLSTNQEQPGSWIVCRSEAERQKSLCAPHSLSSTYYFPLFQSTSTFISVHNKLCGRKWPCNWSASPKLHPDWLLSRLFLLRDRLLDLSSKGLSSLLTYILITIQIGFVPSPTLRVIESVLQCFLICLCMLFRVLLWPGGEDRWGGWANLLWRRGCYSERTETIAECQDLKIQSPQRCKGSVTARASIRVCSASLYIWCIFILNSFCITTSRVYFEHMYNCIIFIILPPGSLWIPED